MTPFVAALRSRVARNALALYGVRFATFALPLLTLPYLTRVMDVATFGVLAFAQAFASWLGILIEYGFSLSATRDIARDRDDPAALSATVTGVLGAKVVLVLHSVVFAAVASRLPAFRGHGELAFLALLIAVIQGMSPVWFFQGVEELRIPALCEVGARLIGTAATFLFVKSASDAWIALASQLLGGTAGVSVGLALMLRRVRPHRPTWRETSKALRLGAGMFLFTAAISLYTAANTFILGLFGTAQALAFFGGVERITRAAAYLIGPLSQALFPRMSYLVATDRAAAARLLRRSAFYIVGFSLLTATFLFTFAPEIVRTAFGAAYAPAASIMRVLSVMIPFIAAGNVLGIQWMLPLRLDRQFNAIVIAAAALNLVLAVALAPRFQATGMAIAATCSEALVAIGIYLVLRRTRQLPF